MIRRFVYLLLVAVTLQLSWGTVSAYCEHESGKAARHLGHHEHDAPSADIAAADRATSTHDDGTSGAKKSAPHTHCSSCSHAALAAITLDPGFAHPRPAGLTSPAPAIHLTSAYTTPPERPQWLHAA